jgi:hypothetical protein
VKIPARIQLLGMSVRLGKTEEGNTRMEQFCKVRPSSILRCVAQESPEILKSVSAVLPRSAKLISNNFSISPLSVALGLLHPAKHVSCLRCYGFASTNGWTPTAMQVFQPIYPFPNLNQLKRDVEGKRNIGRVCGLVKRDWPSDSVAYL